MKNKLFWLEAALLLAPFLLLPLYWNEIPAQVPIHWNIDNQIDRWAPKLGGLLFLPLTSLAIIALLHFLPWLDPKLRGDRGTSERMQSVLPILRLSFAAFFFILFLLVFGAARGHTDLVGRIVPTAVLFLLAVIGNYLGNVRPNYFVGFRTPWTLESPATWRATHRLGGRLLFFSSVALLLLQFFVSPRLFFIALVATMLSLAVWTFLYSWHHFRNDASTSRPL